jgi:hypothetical protein
MSGHAGRIEWVQGASLSVAWRLGDGALLTVVANLAPTSAPVPDATPLAKGEALYSTVPMRTGRVVDLEPWTVMWFLERGGRVRARP